MPLSSMPEASVSIKISDFDKEIGNEAKPNRQVTKNISNVIKFYCPRFSYRGTVAAGLSYRMESSDRNEKMFHLVSKIKFKTPCFESMQIRKVNISKSSSQFKQIL